MVLTAPTANNFTVIATNTQNLSDLQREVDLSERSIRNAATRQKYYALFDARIIGNPTADPQDDAILSQMQIDYRDTFINAGYLVTLDPHTGFWKLSWAEQGVEELVSVYSVRTTVIPGAVSVLTEEAIVAFFETVVPVVRPRVNLNTSGSGADINEGDFGAPFSVFYEYVVIAQQQDPTVDYSNDIRTALITTPLGYTMAPSNVFVYKLV